jgi:hypothetical protein
MKQNQLNKLTDITIVIDSGSLMYLIGAIIGIGIYVGILEYRFRKVENHTFLRAIRDLQREQIVDMARNMLRRDNN